MTQLFTWKLTPADQSLAIWKFSSYREPVIVRAKDESQARSVAAEKFGTADRADGAGVEAGNPWHSPEAVHCEKWQTRAPSPSRIFRV